MRRRAKRACLVWRRRLTRKADRLDTTSFSPPARWADVNATTSAGGSCAGAEHRPNVSTQLAGGTNATTAGTIKSRVMTTACWISRPPISSGGRQNGRELGHHGPPPRDHLGNRGNGRLGTVDFERPTAKSRVT